MYINQFCPFPPTQLIPSPLHLIPELWAPFIACPCSSNPGLQSPPPFKCQRVRNSALPDPPVPLKVFPLFPSAFSARPLIIPLRWASPSLKLPWQRSPKTRPRRCPHLPDFCASDPPVATPTSGNALSWTSQIPLPFPSPLSRSPLPRSIGLGPSLSPCTFPLKLCLLPGADSAS